MSYCLYTDISDAVGGDNELKRISKSNPLNTTLINESIAQADSLIDLLCNGSSGFPFSTPAPEFIKQLSIDLAIYNLYQRVWSLSTIPAAYVDLYNKAMDLLKQIAAGELSASGEPAKSINNKGYYFYKGRNITSTNPRSTLPAHLQYL